MKRLWLVRLGKHGEQEAHALAASELKIGFRVGDLTSAGDREAMLKLVETTYPDKKPRTVQNFAAQLNQFGNTMRVGDLVVVPLKTMDAIAIGEIAGPAGVSEDGYPVRPVRWLETDLQRDTFRQDLLYSFGAFLTVCEVSRNNALPRVEAVISKGRDPGYDGAARETSQSEETPAAEDAEIEPEAAARIQIERKIATDFTGHQFTYLVAAVLEAQGFVVNVSKEGPDQGIDIVAGRGKLGFESPRLVVQVKSGNVMVDQPTLQALIGSVNDTQADQGLLVSWAGFKKTVTDRRNELFFRIRLWGRTEFLDALFDVYDRLPEAVRAELPLRKTWMLVPEPEEDAI